MFGGVFPTESQACLIGSLTLCLSFTGFHLTRLGILADLILMNNFPIMGANEILGAILPNLYMWKFLLKGRNQ